MSTEAREEIATLTNKGYSDLDYSTHVRYYPEGLPGLTTEETEFGDTIRYDLNEVPSGYYG